MHGERLVAFVFLWTLRISAANFTDALRHLLPNFRIAVVGAGAIGLYYGGKLAHFGRDVHFLVRTDYETVRKRGLRIRSKSENIHIAKVHASRSTQEIGQCDLVIVAVKTTSNEDLPPLVAPLLGEKTMILTLQNGLGNEEFLARHFGAERILGGVCFICLNRTAPGVVERRCRPPVDRRISRLSPPAPARHRVGIQTRRRRLPRGGKSRARTLAQTRLEHSV